MVAATLLAACASDGPAPVESRTSQTRTVPAPAATTTPASTATGLPQSYSIRKGDSLAAIAFRFGLDVRDLARWNELRDPNLIYPGQKLLLHAPGSQASAPAPRRPAGDPSNAANPEVMIELPRPTAVTAGDTAASEAPAKPSLQTATRDPGPSDPSGRWLWPTEGEITPSVSAMGTKGIRIIGTRGQAIAAVANGEVVYSGSGLRGYGNLIIIRHDAEFLSAYAHNDKILVREGDQVMAGQKIAEMGDTGAQQVMLHFELRVKGIAVDPLRYLPRRTAAHG
jgi:lipoprotein NlpD